MSQTEDTTRLSSSSSHNNVPSQHDTAHHRSSFQPRHYATIEESDAVLPIFSTPTQMYIRQELNSQRYAPSPKQQYTASPVQNHRSANNQQYTATQQPPVLPVHDPNVSASGSRSTSPSSHTHSNQYGKTRNQSSPPRQPVDNFDMSGMRDTTCNMYTERTSTSATTPQQDLLLAQLVDMGFTLEAAQVAMVASGGTNLQEILDILVQDARAAGNNLPPPARPDHPPPRPVYQQPLRPDPVPPARPEHTVPIPPTSHPVPPARPVHKPSPTPPPRHPPKKSSDDEDEDPRIEKEREAQFKKEQEERRKEYLENLKKTKPTPPAPSPRPPPKASPQKTTTSDPATFFADKERKQGNYLFNKNQFPEAEAAYTLAIDMLPPGHSELVLLSNNRAAARLKQNKYHQCLADCSVAIDVARKQMSLQTEDTDWKAQMIKALHRKACALEGLHLFEAAIGVYEEYVRMDGSRSVQVTQGIIRCQQALLDSKKNPPPQPPRPTNGHQWKPANDMSAFPDIDFNMFVPTQTPEEKARLEEINKSKAVKEMRNREKQKEAEDAERLSKEDKVSAQISVWKTGKDKNLRALLGSLELILWPGVQWKSVTMGELLEPRKCKMAYMKAIAKVHPDKLPANATVEQRMLASGIFTTLNQAWDLFKTQNNL